MPGFGWLKERLVDRDLNARVRQLEILARKIDATAAQVAIAWCTLLPAVSSVILGARGPDQLRHNLGAMKVVSRLSPDILRLIYDLFE
jgi:aryl-alcohol dehydrogenase-like predicted oxidoreductase